MEGEREERRGEENYGFGLIYTHFAYKMTSFWGFPQSDVVLYFQIRLSFMMKTP